MDRDRSSTDRKQELDSQGIKTNPDELTNEVGEPMGTSESIEPTGELETGDIPTGDMEDMPSDPDEIEGASDVAQVSPDSVDASSGIETEGVFDDRIDVESPSSVQTSDSGAVVEVSDAAGASTAPQSSTADTGVTANNASLGPVQSTKRPDELIMIDRGPRVPVVFLDPETKQQVVPAHVPSIWDEHPFRMNSGAESQAETSSEAGADIGLARPPLVVTMHRARQHFQDAFEAHAERLLHITKATCNDRFSDFQHHQASLDRAIFGQF